MTHKTLLLFLLIGIFSRCSKNHDDKVKLTFIEQSGVFIESADKKILIDALFKSHPDWPYPYPSMGLLDSMESAKAPFNNIDLFFVTHAHVDHAYTNSLEKGLKSNPNSILITTPVMAQFMNRYCEDFKSIKHQVCTPKIPYGEMMDTVIHGVDIHIAHLKHMYDGEWADVVYSFLIEVNGKKILHNAGSIGYFVDEYKKIRYDTMNIDVAILYYDFLTDTNSTGKLVLDKYIKPKNILLGHRSYEDKAFMDSIKTHFSKEYPYLDVLKTPLESWEY